LKLDSSAVSMIAIVVRQKQLLSLSLSHNLALQREGWHNRLDEGSLQRHIAEHKQRMEDLRLQMGVMHTKRAEIVDRALEKLQLVLERSQSDTLARILKVR
jgi:hypothetical protein